jgi:hypothetical protein
VSRYRQSLKRSLREHAEEKRRAAVAEAVGRARLRHLTRDWDELGAVYDNETRDVSQEMVRRDEQGRIRALIATAPVTEDAPPAADPPATEVPEIPAPADRTPADQTLDPPEGGIAFTIPVAVLEGYETPDGRFLTAGNGGRRDLPMTLMAMLENPNGGWGHDGAIAVGRVDTLERFDASAEINPLTGETYGAGVFGWKATGWLTPHPDQEGSEAAVQFIRDQVIRGVSVDLDEFEAHEEILAVDEDGWPTDWRIIVDEWSIGQMTVCPFAAFPGATIVLDEEDSEEPAPAPIAASGQPGTLTVRGSSCAPCDAAALTASAAPVAAEEDTVPTYPPRAWFDRQPMHDSPMDRHVYVGRHPDGTPTGQVWGRIAEWETCHSGVGDSCVMAPRLGEAGYRSFHTRGTVYTAEGDELGVGLLTHGGGHANINLGITPALAHYDTAGTALVRCRMGEDDTGIWYAGAFKPGTTRAQIEDFAAHPLSGDWRADPGDRDVRFVTAVSVNVPGYRIGSRFTLAASGHRAILAAGAGQLTKRSERGGTDAASVKAAIDRALRPVLASAARTRLRDLTRPRT